RTEFEQLAAEVDDAVIASSSSFFWRTTLTGALSISAGELMHLLHRPFQRVLGAAIALISLAAAAAPNATWGPEVGGRPLAGLTAQTVDGTTVELDALAAQSEGLVIAFVRSADWCPFCKRQLIDLSKRHQDFTERGLTLVSVSYDSTEILGQFQERFEIAFALLSDPQSQIIDAFGIRNEQHKPGSAGYGIPHPGIMVFDREGVLVLKFAEKGYRKRPKVDDVLAAVDAR
ncbi:MAG: peroxiredoxin family protein, partial [Pseudomonadota bacterium]